MTTTPPTNPTPEPIEQQLAQATQWTGGDTALWQRALEQVERESKPARPSILATINRHARMAAMIAIGTIAVIVAAVTTSQTASRPDYHLGAMSVVTSESPRSEPASRRVPGDDIVLGRTAGEDKMLYRLQSTPVGGSESYADSPDAFAGKPERAPDAKFDQSDAVRDRVALADVPLPGSDNPNSQVFAGQHAELPPVPTSAAEVPIPGSKLANAQTNSVLHSALPAAADTAAGAAPPALSSAAPDAARADKLAFAKSSRDESREQAEPDRRAGAAGSAIRELKEEAQSAPAPAPQRAIVRTVNMNLGVTDVRAAFTSIEARVSTSPAGYIESSELHGEGLTASASIVIRVPADQLDPLVAAVRPLGKVLVETSAAQDVGEQLVDLEARLSNAQRFEGELLETLNKTTGAKPNEILEVQRAVSEVRETIERLAAQRARLSRQIALSTIRITLTAEPDDQTPARTQGLGAYLADNLRSAWRSGLVAIADTFAWIVRIAVGGAIWWALLIIALLLTRRWFKKHPRQSV